MFDNATPDTVSYEHLISILRERTDRRESQADRDYLSTLWHDLLMLDAQVRKQVSETERGH
jgi:hypothetical protein